MSVLSPAFDPFAVLDERKNLDSTRFCYKLVGIQYALDAPLSETSIDESKMSARIIFASGKRRDSVGDLLEVGGIRTERHRKNACWLFDHGKSVSLPIGMALERDEQGRYDTNKYTVDIDPVSQEASANVFFYQGKGMGIDGAKEYSHGLFVEQLYHMLATKMLTSGSLGYSVVKALQLQPDYETGTPQGLHLLVTLMLEGSLVVLPANQDTVAKMLAMPSVCGKPLSPVLVKSLSAYAEPETKTVSGWISSASIEQKSIPADLDWQQEEQREQEHGERKKPEVLQNLSDTAGYYGYLEGRYTLAKLKSVRMKYRKSFKTRSKSLNVGDKVIIIEGDYSGYEGVVTRIGPDGPKVKIPGQGYAITIPEAFLERKSINVKSAASGQVDEGRYKLEAWRSGQTSSSPLTDWDFDDERSAVNFARSQATWAADNNLYLTLRDAETGSKRTIGKSLPHKAGMETFWVKWDDYGVQEVPYNSLELARAKVEELRKLGFKPEIWDQQQLHRIKRFQKSLPNIRLKYRSVKMCRKRHRKSSPGSSFLYVSGKDLDKVREEAESKGLKFQRVGSKGKAEKVKLTGDDNVIDGIAKNYGRRVKRMKTKGDTEEWVRTHIPKPASDDDSSRFQVGDHVDIVDGELRGMEGTIVRMPKPGQFPEAAVKIGGNTHRINLRNLKSLSRSKKIPPAKWKPGAGAVKGNGKMKKAMIDGDDTRTMKLDVRQVGNGYIVFNTATGKKVAGPFRDFGAAHAEAIQLERGEKGKSMKQLTRQVKAAPEGMPPDDQISATPDGSAETGTDEPLGAQVLRRMHQDSGILMQEYHEMIGLLENETVKARLQGKLEALEAEMSEIEAEFVAEYEELEGLEGAGDDEDKDLDDEEETEEVEEEVKADDDATVEAGSDGEEEVPEEDVVEGMQTKSIKEVRKAYKKKSKDDDDKKKEDDNKDKSIKTKAMCPECGKEPCTCDKKDIGDVPNEGADNQNPFEPHELAAVGEAKDFLGQVGDLPSLEDSHRNASYHHAKALGGIAGRWEKDFAPMDEQDANADVNEPGEMGMKSDNGKDIKPTQDEIELAWERGTQAAHAGKPQSACPYDTSDLWGRTLRRAWTDGWEEYKSGSKSYNQDDELSKAYPHHKTLKGASGFLERLSSEKAFGDAHREEAKSWHKALDPIGQDEADAPIPGEMDVKGLRETFLRQNKAMEDLQHNLELIHGKL